jgi:hypothetical protein
MKGLLEVRHNLFYTKKKSDNEFIKQHEIFLIVDEPSYKRTNEGDIVRERGCKELRFILSSESLELFIKTLELCKESKEEDLH